MKKYIFRGMIALTAALASVACTDDLDQQPHIGDTAQTVYSTITGYRMAAAKIFTSYSTAGSEKASSDDLSSNNGYDLMRNLFQLQEGPTDECAYRWLSGDNLSDLAYMRWDATESFVTDTYYRLYYNIALCNDMLRNAANVPAGFSDDEKAEVRRLAAQVRFFRAMSYAWVLDLYGHGPFVDENTPQSNFTPEAYTGEQLLNYIESELSDILADMPDAPDYAAPGKGAVYALQSRVFLNAATTAGVDRYTECVTAVKNLLAMGRYSLEPDFAKLFNADNHKRTNEIILAFAVDHANCPTWGTTTNIVQGSCGSDNSQDPAKYGINNGWGNYRLRGEYAELFGGNTEGNPDSRCMIFTTDQTQWLDNSIDEGSAGYHLEKWTNLTDDGQKSCDTADGVDTDYPAFRLAEVLLNGAEAIVRGGTGMSRAEALDMVNQVRRRAYGDATGEITNAQLTLDFLLDERGRELAYESLRRSDLVRHDKFTTGKYLWQWKGGVKSGRAVDDKYNFYPIPATELAANPNMSNPLY